MNTSNKTLENGGVDGPTSSSLEAVARCIPSCGMDFGYCTVSLETNRKIHLENIVPRSVTGQSIRYSIETDSHNFSVSHSNGNNLSQNING